MDSAVLCLILTGLFSSNLSAASSNNSMPSLVTVSQGTDGESGLDLEELMEPGRDIEELMEPELGPEIIIPGPLVVRQQMGGARRVVQLDQADYRMWDEANITTVESPSSSDEEDGPGRRD